MSISAPTARRADHWSAVESWSRDRIEEHQATALARQLRRVHEGSAFYRRQWAELGFEPNDLTAPADLARLPLVRKTDYTAALAEDEPWGSMLGVPREEVARVHFSSGTTAAPTPVYWTARDLERWADLYARASWSQGVRSHDVYHVLFGFSWFVGGLGVTALCERIGCAAIPGGSGDTERQIDVLHRFGVTAASGTPSFMLHLARTAADLGRPLHTSAVARIQVGGEPGGCIPQTRAAIEEAWGARVFDGYGSLEFQPIAWECEHQAGGHLAEDFAYAEVLDVDTAQPVPDGTPGVLVLTHLDKEATPLVRWWTGDVVVRDRTPCGCGRTLARLVGGVRGRADDMLVVKGVNVLPSGVEDVVRRVVGPTAEYRIVVDRDVTDDVTGYLTGIKVRVEADPADRDRVASDLARAVRAELTVRTVVDCVPLGSLKRSTHKAQRIVRES